MNRFLKSSFIGVALIGATSAFAQGSWAGECWDGQGDQYSPDYGISGLQNDLIGFTIGASGTANWNGTNCWNPARGALNAVGRFSFFTGPTGSVQTDLDNSMALTTGAPFDPVGDFTYFRIIKGSNTVLFGQGGLTTLFTGASRRYIATSWRDTEVDAQLEIRVIGDALRFRWRLRNLTNAALPLGLKFGATYGMRSGGDRDGFNQSNSLLGGNTSNPRASNDPVPYIGFTELPTVRPVRTERNYLRSSPRFPDFVNYQWSQAEPYGFRTDMGPTPALPDHAEVDQLIIADHFPLLWQNNMRSRVFNDPGQGDPILDTTFDPILEDSDLFMDQPAFINVFGPQPVQAGGTREIVHYIRAPWSVGDYLDPYSVLVDAPRIVETDPNATTNGLTPNPMRIVAYLDNQYADLDREVALTNVRMKIQFPQGSGLRLADGEPAEKLIARIEPNAINSVEWQVVADGQQVGYQPYNVTFSPTPGPSKTINGTVLVSATPRLRLAEGANLVTFPWEFSDSSLEAIFGPIGDPNGLKIGRDFLAYRWDPGLNSYEPVTSAPRGTSLWIVPRSDQGFRALNGAQVPSDQGTGGVVTLLSPGWNMIGNPYSVPVPLSQLIGVGEDDPAQSLTWADLVNNGWVSGSLAFWQRSADDPTSGSYLFTDGNTALIQPQVGYWVYVSTLRPIRISWPPLFTPGLTSANRTANPVAWRQTDKQWRLQLVARGRNGADASNYVGVAANAANAKRFRIYEPPTAPEAQVELSIRETIDGKPTRLAQSLADRFAKRTWKLTAKSTVSGPVTVTWPNINSVPRNARITLRDVAANTTRDLRFTSGYSFEMPQPGSREFEVTIEPGGSTRAVIGNVTVGRPSRSPGAPLSINYALSTDAVTSIRILSGAGREVFTVSRGRSVSAGENSATWNLRDNANRAVAPGTYQVEIVAETASGERVRRVVPVNIVR